MGPKQSAKAGKRQKRDDENDSDDSDDDLQPLHFFVPGENINAAVLVEYINRYVDRTAKITSAQHPTDKTRTGFNVLAKRALNAVSIRDLINDSKDWDMETQGREYKRDPYDYRESDTARRRARKGPSEGGTNRPQHPRGKREGREGTAEPTDGPRQDRSIVPTTSAATPQSQYQTAQYAQYTSHGQPQHNIQTSSSGYYTLPSRGDQSATNLNITVNTATAQFGSGRGGPGGQHMPTYQNPGYAQFSQQESEVAPPPYSSRGGGGGPQPPSNPGPDTFDPADKPAISRHVAQTTRQTSADSKEEFGRSHSAQQDRRPSTYDQSQSGRRSAR